jgi:DNA-binding NarL/FixJ family response regulator
MVALKTNILLADDHAVVRQGLRLVLENEPDLVVCAEAGDGLEAVQIALVHHELDLVVLDISMPRMTGLDTAREIHRQRPTLKILMLSMHDNEQFLHEALQAGASGYVLKSLADRDLVRACRSAVRGEPFLYPGAITEVIRHYLAKPSEDHPDPLTPRELQVIKLIAEGNNNHQIAESLTISEKTVERHRANMLEKLGMRDRVELTRYAIRRGLVEP